MSAVTSILAWGIAIVATIILAAVIYVVVIAGDSHDE